MSVGTIVQLDPKLLRMAPNVRTDVKLTKEFVASIKEHGVLVPITVQEREDGFDVIDGQRRTLAALDLALESVDCYVAAAPATDADRIVSQIVVNETRSELDEHEAAIAVKDLALFGMNVAAIAKKTGLPSKFVKRAAELGKSEKAVELLGQIDLDEAVIIAEFEDFPDQQKKLLAFVGKQDWLIRQTAQEFRDERELARVKAEIAAMSGVQVIKAASYDTDPRAISYLYRDADHKDGLDGLAHEKLVELAGDGLCAYPALEWVDGERQGVVRYAVKGWKARGLFSVNYGSEKSAAPKSPEEIEKLKLERRAARESTKAWVAAGALRVEFLRGLVQRKTMPKGWEPLIVGRMINDGTNGTSGNPQWRMAITILGLRAPQNVYSQSSVVATELNKTPARALQIALGVWAGSIEGGYEFDRKGWSQSGAKPYLLKLREWGYELTEVECRTAGLKVPAAKVAA